MTLFGPGDRISYILASGSTWADALDPSGCHWRLAGQNLTAEIFAGDDISSGIVQTDTLKVLTAGSRRCSDELQDCRVRSYAFQCSH